MRRRREGGREGEVSFDVFVSFARAFLEGDGWMKTNLRVELGVGLSLSKNSGSVVGELLLLDGGGELSGFGGEGLGVLLKEKREGRGASEVSFRSSRRVG